jgi:hypothetical protein
MPLTAEVLVGSLAAAQRNAGVKEKAGMAAASWLRSVQLCTSSGSGVTQHSQQAREAAFAKKEQQVAL